MARAAHTAVSPRFPRSSGSTNDGGASSINFWCRFCVLHSHSPRWITLPRRPLIEASGGTAGEPSKASREGGDKYHRHLVDRLVQVIEMLQG